MGSVKTPLEKETSSTLRLLPEAGADNAPAWELLEAGRYMPRRIRGSYRGRELG